MTTREKFIVGATVVAVLYAGVTLLQGRRDKPSEGKGGAPSVDLSAFVSQSRAQLAGIRLSAGERTVLDAVQSDWAGEPFAVFSGEAAVKSEGAAGVPAYTYTGYVRAGGVRLAIINGREYRENETLADGSGVVDSIAPDRVVLRVGGEDRLRTLMFENPGLTKE